MATAFLKAFLENPARPDGTLNYHELQGFLFAIASSPELIRPSEWIPQVFGEGEPAYESVDELKSVLAELMDLYNAVNASASADEVSLPPDCTFLDDALANLQSDSPISMWSRGFALGHQWLEEAWDEYLPQELDHDAGAMLMTLSFFASREIAEALCAEVQEPDLGAMAKQMQELFPVALGEYAHLGRAIFHAVQQEREASTQRVSSKVGRNDPCPCGSGRKFKRCCGS